MPVKKIVDKWKLKKWFTILAPELFERKTIGETVCSDEKLLIGRKIGVMLDMLTGSYAMPNPYTKMLFRISDVKGNNCYTEYVGHELLHSYISTLVRRRRSLIDHVFDEATQDKKRLRIKAFVVTQIKISKETRTAIRKALEEFLRGKITSMKFNDFLKELLFGKLNVELYGLLKKIAPIGRVEIKKLQLIDEKKEKKDVKATATS